MRAVTRNNVATTAKQQHLVQSNYNQKLIRKIWKCILRGILEFKFSTNDAFHSLSKLTIRRKKALRSAIHSLSQSQSMI